MGLVERERVVALVKSDIAGRIRRVCPDFDEAEFDKLVERMARIDIRYRLRDDWGFRTRRQGDQN